MSSLNASLANAVSGMIADQGALEVTTNNVANVNTPGYSREQPVLVASDPVVVDPLTLGTGVTLQSIESIRDPLLDSQIAQQTQSENQYSTLSSALQEAQVNFTSTTGDIGTSISNFFDSINQLSTDPSDLSLRQDVLTAADNLATSFNTTANNLTEQQGSLDSSVVQQVSQINQLSQQIAQLNGQIASLQNVGQSAGTFLDQRQQAIDQLSSLVDVSVIPADNSITITTANGAPLVTGLQSYQLTTETNSAGLHEIDSGGNDITSEITSGQLGGTLASRDQAIPSILGQLDTLAAGIANSVNAVQTSGYDLNGNLATNENLFNSPPANTTGAAATLSVAMTDPSEIAASSDGTSGSDGNAQAMYALSTSGSINGQSPSDYYSSIVSNVGNQAANASAEQTASQAILEQLTDQQASVSGVSLNEEAANMVQYQNAFQASAQVVTTINDMMYAVIQMSTLTG
jgi:flagellar hook-associated protein 1 FlgK